MIDPALRDRLVQILKDAAQGTPMDVYALPEDIWWGQLVDALLASEEWKAREAVVEAVLYAMKAGCFFPVPEPSGEGSSRVLVQWGAIRNLHDRIAALARLASTRRTT